MLETIVLIAVGCVLVALPLLAAMLLFPINPKPAARRVIRDEFGVPLMYVDDAKEESF